MRQIQSTRSIGILLGLAAALALGCVSTGSGRDWWGDPYARGYGEDPIVYSPYYRTYDAARRSPYYVCRGCTWDDHHRYDHDRSYGNEDRNERADARRRQIEQWQDMRGVQKDRWSDLKRQQEMERRQLQQAGQWDAQGKQRQRQQREAVSQEQRNQRQQMRRDQQEERDEYQWRH